MPLINPKPRLKNIGKVDCSLENNTPNIAPIEKLKPVVNDHFIDPANCPFRDNHWNAPINIPTTITATT